MTLTTRATGDVFIQAFRGYYAFDIAPAFWQALVEEASNGRLLSIDRVRHEIEQGKDDLANWAVNNFQEWFASTAESDVLESYGKIMRWAHAQPQYSDAAKTQFAEENNADAWLVACADAKNCIIVTLEQFNPNTIRFQSRMCVAPFASISSTLTQCFALWEFG